MDYKKLTNILIKDLIELDDLIDDLRVNRQFESFDIEYLHIRVKGVKQIAERLANFEVMAPEKKYPEIKVNEDAKVVKNELHGLTPSDIQIKSGEEPESITEPRPEPEMQPENKVAELLQNHVLQPTAIMSGIETVEEEKELPELPVIPESLNPEPVVSLNTEPPGQVTPVKEEPKILGEKFTKEKSVNDLMPELGNLESKLGNRPIESLSNAIGINDRFLYIRELFGGDGEKFNGVIKTIDSFGNIGEAVEFLKINFQWKSNETSQKFLNLVKRRFLNG